MLLWHRRAGKDEVALHWTACAAMQRAGNYWHQLPEASQARKALWEAVNPHTGKRRIDEAFPAGIRAGKRDDEMIIRFKNGSTWQVVGSDNFDSLVGSPPVGLTFSEYALSDPRAWSYLRPILAENNGWAIFPFTPRGENHGKTLFEGAKSDPDWFAQRLTASQTDVFDAEFLEKERAEYVRENGFEDGNRLFRQEYYCDFEAAVRGAYYAPLIIAAEEDGRICRVPYDPALPVYTSWDLGVGDATTIWWIQITGREVRWIDYYEANGVGLDHYAKVIREKGYGYKMHWPPHDIAVTELGTGKSRMETLEALDIGPIEAVPRLAVDDRINAARTTIPMSWFDAEKCARGIQCLKSYAADWDDRNKVLRRRPRHDWASHGADAYGYGCLMIKDAMQVAAPARTRPVNTRRIAAFN